MKNKLQLSRTYTKRLLTGFISLVFMGQITA